MLNVGALREGYVLDHIKAGKAMTIYHDLKLDKLYRCHYQECPQPENGQKRYHQG